MRRTTESAVAAVLAAFVALAGGARADELKLDLAGGWAIQSSAKVGAAGAALSRAGADTTGWHATSVPSTVVSALVADGTYPDPYFGTNLRQIPGTSYDVGQNFSNLPMPKDSPFAVPWWYRTEFVLPPGAAGKTLWLRFGGVNFRFAAWLNGTRVADPAKTAGAWRSHELDVTGVAKPGRNALAVLVSAPLPNDLAITFVDWNPMPPDKVMGIYRPVTLTASGPVALRHPQVVTKVAPALDRAELVVKAFARNATRAAVSGTLRGRIGAIAFEKPVALAAGESREIVFSPADFPALVVREPKLWWPVNYGPQHLHRLELEFSVGENVSDRASASFGIREFASEMTPEGHLVFKVNGRRILIRGAGWTSEMMLRRSAEREQAEILYVKDLGLNTIRLEGKLEDDGFFDTTDREGILVMPGWCCCDYWEQWDKWTPKDLPIATASLRDQILRLRGRASVFTWLNGSDGPPPAPVERAYLRVLKQLGFPNPIVSSATEKRASSGPSGFKMRGPYDWVPPVYWYTDTKLGGPHGFATEIGPGPSPPPLESLKRFLPADKLWPVNEAWNYHCGGGPFKTLDVFNAALDARYGPSKSVEEYARKAQVAAYESHRAMLESFGARKYVATGVIQWMLNNAWPSMIWHLYDFYLRPGGSYFGAKKAGEPLHVQYSYDDGSVLVVNQTLEARQGLKVTARIVGLDSAEKLRREASVDVSPDGVARALALPAVEGPEPTYFLFLTLEDAAGRTLSRNVYWLSTRQETLLWEKSDWYHTPVARYADLTGLERLPAASVRASASFEAAGPDGRARAVLENTSGTVAFFVHVSVRKGEGGEELLPALFEDNDLTLLPGERREVTVRYATRGLEGSRPALAVEGWNVAPVSAP